MSTSRRQMKTAAAVAVAIFLLGGSSVLLGIGGGEWNVATIAACIGLVISALLLGLSALVWIWTMGLSIDGQPPVDVQDIYEDLAVTAREEPIVVLDESADDAAAM